MDINRSLFSLLRVVGIVFVPLFKNFLPINVFAVCYCFGLNKGFIVQSLLGMAHLHGFNGSFVKNLYSSTTYTFVQIGLTECFSLYVEV